MRTLRVFVVLTLCILGVIAGAASADDRAEARAARRSPVVEVFESARDAVVNISSKEIITVRSPFDMNSIFQDLFDMPSPGHPFGSPGLRGRQYTRTSVGSGFVIHPDGYIVTNAHVVAQTVERKAIFADGREYDAQIVAIDTSRDLAVLKIDTTAHEPRKPLPTIRLGRSDDLMIGETVIAIGNPVGLQHTVTAGVISAIDRDLEFAPASSGRRGMTLHGLIQTDASINPGNSGGPLLNVLGELIGINTAIRGDAQNIGFAIPVDQLREILPELLDIERRYRIVCGLSVDTLNSPTVTAVKHGSPAEQAGLKVGDVLRAIDGRPIHEGIDFSIALIGRDAGETMEIEYLRDDRACSTKLTLAARPVPDGALLAIEKLGVQIEPLTPSLAEAIGLPGATGLLIANVEHGGPAERIGVRRRDVLIAIGRHPVSAVADLGELLEFVESGDAVPITVMRLERRVKYMLQGEVEAR